MNSSWNNVCVHSFWYGLLPPSGNAEREEFLRVNPQYGAYTYKKRKDNLTTVVQSKKSLLLF